jgi:hypothetical protein
MFKKILPALLALTLATLACGFRVQPPAPTPGALVTDEITLKSPDAKSAFLTLEFGAGKLSLAPGGETNLVEGTAAYNVPDFKPEISIDGAQVKIAQGEYTVDGWPDLNDVENAWDFKLGGGLPLDLTVKAGAYEGDLELGGLPLLNLDVSDGAATVDLRFSQPNPERMKMLRYQTGASTVKLYDLANANFTSLVFEGGAGNYTLDFGGELRNDASVTIRAGVSNVTLLIPNNISAQVTVDHGLSNVDFGDGWTKNGDTYTQAGEGPTLTIVVEVGAGNLNIGD